MWIVKLIVKTLMKNALLAKEHRLVQTGMEGMEGDGGQCLIPPSASKSCME